MTLNQKQLYHLITEAFRKAGREVHENSTRGVFILASDLGHYHDICITVYPVHAMKGPFLPRMNINTTWAMERLPKHIASKWGVARDSSGLFCKLGLEVTILETQYPEIADALPRVIEFIEQGNRSGFETVLPFPVRFTTPTNIWSQLAHDVATASLHS